jgi:hypothetical protein
MNDNPYASPVDCERGVYDHRLFWRLLKTAAVLIVPFAIMDTVVILSHKIDLADESVIMDMRIDRVKKTIGDQLERFFGDGNGGGETLAR